MNYLKEQLETQYSLNFADVRKEIILFNLDVYADLVYIEVRLSQTILMMTFLFWIYYCF